MKWAAFGEAHMMYLENLEKSQDIFSLQSFFFNSYNKHIHIKCVSISKHMILMCYEFGFSTIDICE